MKLFSYTAFRSDGSKISGEIKGVSRAEVLDRLRDDGYIPVDITETDQSAGEYDNRPGGIFQGGPSAAALTLFTRELAMMLKAGLMLDQALSLLSMDAGSDQMATLILKIRTAINEGKSFHEALLTCNPAFPSTYVRMIEVAEASGTLDVVLERIADGREREQKIKSKAMSAMLYPLMLILTAIGAIAVMLIVVVPKFKDMLAGVEDQIPTSTKFVLSVSDWLVDNSELLTGGLLALVFALALLGRWPLARLLVGAVALRMPLLGQLIRLNMSARFCRTMGILLENGVSLPAALGLTKNVMSSAQAKTTIGAMEDALRQGQELTKPLDRSKLFPPIVANMLKVATETGQLAGTSLYLAQMFEDKLELAVQRLFTILEPVIIIFVSLIVAGIVISIIGAVVSINDLAI